MSRSQRFRDVFEQLEGIADTDEISQIFRGQHDRYVGSPEEEICQFFDDLEIRSFAETSDELSEDQRKALCEIVGCLAAAANDFGQFIDVEAFLANRHWRDAQRKAKAFVDRWRL